MKFRVDKEVFNRLPNLCFGVVVAKGIEGVIEHNYLEGIEEELKERYSGMRGKEVEGVIPYREVFRELGYNPNKFMPSIEALVDRTIRGKGLPRILPLVDLYNYVSLKYLLPIGGHDLRETLEDIEVRFSKKGDSFMPFGGKGQELLNEGELVYAIGSNIKTRRWIWRQGDLGKVCNDSKDIFFPIDGFEGINDDRVREASVELAEKLRDHCGCSVEIGYINSENIEVEI